MPQRLCQQVATEGGSTANAADGEGRKPLSEAANIFQQKSKLKAGGSEPPPQQLSDAQLQEICERLIPKPLCPACSSQGSTVILSQQAMSPSRHCLLCRMILVDEVSAMPCRRNVGVAELRVEQSKARGGQPTLEDLLIEESWRKRLRPEFKKPYMAKLQGFLHKEWANQKIYPPKHLVFRQGPSSAFLMKTVSCTMCFISFATAILQLRLSSCYSCMTSRRGCKHPSAHICL